MAKVTEPPVMPNHQPGNHIPQTDDERPDSRPSGPEWVAALGPRSGLASGALVGAAFGLAVAMVLWPTAPGNPSRSHSALTAASEVLLTAAVFAGLFGVVGLVVGLVARALHRTGR